MLDCRPTSEAYDDAVYEFEKINMFGLRLHPLLPLFFAFGAILVYDLWRLGLTVYSML